MAPNVDSNDEYKSDCPLYSDDTRDVAKRFQYNFLRGANAGGFSSIEDLLQRGTWEEVKQALSCIGMRYEGTKLVTGLMDFLGSLEKRGLDMSPWTAVEAGPGGGDQLYHMAGTFRRVIGVEYDETLTNIAKDLNEKILTAKNAPGSASSVELVCDEVCRYMEQHSDGVQLLLMSMVLCHLPEPQKWSLIESLGKSDVKIFVLSCIFKGEPGFSGTSSFSGIHLTTVSETLQKLQDAGMVLVKFTDEKSWKQFVAERYSTFSSDSSRERFSSAVSAEAYESQLGFFSTVHEAFERGMVGATMVLMKAALASELGLEAVAVQKEP